MHSDDLGTVTVSVAQCTTRRLCEDEVMHVILWAECWECIVRHRPDTKDIVQKVASSSVAIRSTLV